MRTYAGQKLFFIHVMKTAGGTFHWYLRSLHRSSEIYPHEQFESDVMHSYVDISSLLALDASRSRPLKVYSGHFPYVVAKMLGQDLFTITILREPVARTVSYLQRCRDEAGRFRGMELEDIYEDEFAYRFLIENHQAKIFSITQEDRLETLMDVVEIDRSRLELAKENLESVDLVGLTERFDDFLERASESLGLVFPDVVPDVHVADEPQDVDERLLDRIAEDNAMDLELYEFARRLPQVGAGG